MLKLWQIREGLSTLKKWFKVIWNDRQYDHLYLLLIWEHKLQLMLDFFSSDKTTNMPERDEEIRTGISQALKYLREYIAYDPYSGIYDDFDSNKLHQIQLLKMFHETIQDNIDNWWD